MALYVTIYMSLMGKQGLKEVNEMSYSGAHYMAEQLCKTGKFHMAFPEQPFLNEFAVKVDGDIDHLQQQLREIQGAQFGVKIAPDTLLVCVTEANTKEDIDLIVSSCNSLI